MPALGAALLALPATSERPRTVAGVCGATNWACVAECIDAECVDRCLREDCEKALERLKACTQTAGCAPDDPSARRARAASTCQRTFEPAPPSPEKEKAEPCRGCRRSAGGSRGAGGHLGAGGGEPSGGEGRRGRAHEAQPRADYERTLEVTPSGCFVLRTRLEDATLGQGNDWVRAWGASW